MNGIGAVTAIEILANFPITPIKEGETTENMSVLSSLRKFRDWWKTCKAALSSGRSALRSKLKNVQLNEGFPNMNVRGLTIALDTPIKYSCLTDC